MLIKLSTDKSISEVASALPVSAQANRFGVMQVHNLKETMAKKGVEFTRECLIFEVCQPQLRSVAHEVENAIVRIMRQAAD